MLVLGDREQTSKPQTSKYYEYINLINVFIVIYFSTVYSSIIYRFGKKENIFWQ